MWAEYTGGRFTTAQDVVIAGMDPKKGKMTYEVRDRYLIGAALLLDLVREGRIKVTGEGKEAQVKLLDTTEPSDPVSAAALRVVAGKIGFAGTDLDTLPEQEWGEFRGVKRTVAKSLMGRWAQRETRAYEMVADLDFRVEVVAQLERRGLLEGREHRVLGLFRTRRYSVQPAADRDRLMEAVRSVLRGEREPDARTGALLAVVTTGAGWNVRRWMPWRERRAAWARGVAVVASCTDESPRAVISALSARLQKEFRS